MKRFAALFSILSVMLGLLFMAPVSADRPVTDTTGPSTQSCYDAWNGKSFESGSNKNRDYADSGCAKVHGGSCTATSTKKNGKTIKKISCSEPEVSSDLEGEGASDEKVSDPALAAVSKCNANSCDFISKYINPTINMLSVLVGVAVVIGIIWGAIEVSMSAGDPQKSASGKNHIRNAIIALVAYILLFAFLQWVVPGGVA